eukprot:scaffold46107_cov35-Attheya_sp.AAC.1
MAVPAPSVGQTFSNDFHNERSAETLKKVSVQRKNAGRSGDKGLRRELNVVSSSSTSACPVVPITGCSICGPGLCVGDPDAIVGIPGIDQTVSCQQLEQAGLTPGIIPPAECLFLPDFVGDICMCEAPVVTPTKAPVVTPTVAP